MLTSQHVRVDRLSDELNVQVLHHCGENAACVTGVLLG